MPAARIAAALGRQGRPVELLITIDPVTRGIGPDFLAAVKAGARRWINARAGGAEGFDYSDLVAAIGGPYGEAPRDPQTSIWCCPTRMPPSPPCYRAGCLRGRGCWTSSWLRPECLRPCRRRPACLISTANQGGFEPCSA
ncbi:hypothetical protein [Dankookia sp. P2]|uniref:hypothetical protein n=1 Tax=Dankookia sp. P2 TaxID=3423955 RepID=UPI003D67214B